MFDGLEVDFGFAAAGDAVDEDGLLGVVDGGVAEFEGALLVGGEGQGFGREKDFAAEGIAVVDLFAQLDVTFFSELLDGGAVGVGEFEKFGKEHARRFLEDFQGAGLFGSAFF